MNGNLTPTEGRTTRSDSIGKVCSQRLAISSGFRSAHTKLGLKGNVEYQYDTSAATAGSDQSIPRTDGTANQLMDGFGRFGISRSSHDDDQSAAYLSQTNPSVNISGRKSHN